MAATTCAIRPETGADIDAVRNILRAAFPGDAEAKLVEQLRSDGQLVLALVAETATTEIVGYIAFSRLVVETGNQSEHAVGLAPLAVVPEHQRCGIGRALASEGLAALSRRGERLVFVLGDPAYYTQFGFRTETAAPFDSAYAGTHFMALRLASGGCETGYVRYPSAFDALS